MKNNLLKIKYPEIFSKIDVKRTLQDYPDLDIDNLTCGTTLKIWWICSKGHSYKQSIFLKTHRNFGCPICSNHQVLSGFNDLNTFIQKNPQYRFILDSWDYEKNTLKPSEVLPHSNQKFWFKCSNNHSYQQSLNNKISLKHGCPICENRQVLSGFNDLENYIKNHPDFQYILDEWDYNKNIIKPSEISPFSNKNIFFICKNNHSYQQKLSDKISKKYKCPYCSNKLVLPGYNDLKTYINNHQEFQYILDEWDYSKNSKNPDEILPHSNGKYYFICKNGHHFSASLNNRLNKNLFSNCPYCVHQKSIPELTIYEIFKKYDNSTISGAKINGHEIDIFIPSKNICTEYDGLFYHNSEESKIRENNKNISILEDIHNYKFIRIKETNDIEKLNKFKEILDNGLIIYYISNKYDKEYFKRLSKIIEDMIDISMDYKELRETYNNIKIKK